MIWMIVFWSISCTIQYTDANNTRGKENTISMPLLNNMKGILTAEIEVSEMNKHLAGFIQQEIVKGIELAMKDLMEQMIANKTEDAKTTITTFMEQNFKDGVTYVRWGRKGCPDGADIVYTGQVGGNSHKQKGGGVNYLCLPSDPENGYPQSFDNGQVFGAEYQIHSSNKPAGMSSIHYNKEVPCAVCYRKERSSVLMIPGRKSCYKEWHSEYNGYLMSDHINHPAQRDYACVDINAEPLDSTTSNEDGALFYPIMTKCGSLRCPPYTNNADVRCVSGGEGRSRYDTIADIHGLATIQAHDGPNFLAWHRLYLLIYETALGTPLPYWDSSIDQAMVDPTKSIVWTSKYFGNGFGEIETGPFAGFQTPGGSLIRNIGSDGMLFDKRMIPRIWSKTWLREISDPTAEEDDGLEDQHNGVHIWVDGHMDNLALAPHDPVFWLHHCFVDYIWEVFRMRQLARGINSAYDFVPTNITGQNPDETAFGIEGYINRDGYSDRIARVVQYDPMPRCPYCGLSSDMYCNRNIGFCVSREQPSRTYQGNPVLARKVAKANGLAEGKFGRAFKLTRRDKRVRGDSVTLPKMKMKLVWVKRFKSKRDVYLQHPRNPDLSNKSAS